MSQMNFTDLEYTKRKKKTKREEFLDAMDEIIPWSYWVEMIHPYYFNNTRGRKPRGDVQQGWQDSGIYTMYRIAVSILDPIASEKRLYTRISGLISH